jgi:hypothetical protein
MRFCQPQTRFYCGVDLHARTIYITVAQMPAGSPHAALLT